MRLLKTALPSLFAFLAVACSDALLGPAAVAPPATVHASRLATVLDSLRSALDLPALAGAIVSEESARDVEAAGCRRYGGQLNITVNDQLHLGSCGKSLTSALMGVLVDDGLVKWSTTLPEIFPELASSMREEFKPVTVIDILSHASGLPRDPASMFRSEPSLQAQRLALVSEALQQPPAVPRGTYLYSNLAYMIAGAVVERLTHRPYEEVMIDRLLTPLGLTSAAWGPVGTPGLDNEPLSHTFANAPLEPYSSSDLPAIYSPAGRLHLSIADWAKYARWIMAGEHGHVTLLKPETFKTLTTGRTPQGYGWSYGLGWGVFTQSGAPGKVLSHSGSNGFNYCTIWLAPQSNIGVLIATNKGGGDTDTRMNQVLNRVLALAFPPN